MSSQRRYSLSGSFKASPVALFLSVILLAVTQPSGFARRSQDNLRTIVGDDFTKNRPKSRARSNSARKPDKGSPGGRSYRLASEPAAEVTSGLSTTSQLGLTIWKLRRGEVVEVHGPVSSTEKGAYLLGWIAERVEADTGFHAGDYLRLSIESPRAGYLYVIDRDWFTDGSLGETSLIFPIRGDVNRLQAGRLVDIPSASQPPFRATPKPNQAGEILTIMVTSTPLRLPISDRPLPISNTQLMEWKAAWGGSTERFELEGGAGQLRTSQERAAATPTGVRQLTRDDPGPQTIYLINSKTSSAFLFDLRLFYAR
jgi:Domain of unknown function (DUF4384)